MAETLCARRYMQRLADELERLDAAPLERLARRIEQARREGRFVFLFGNGGSGATASHAAEDLGKGTLPAEEAGAPAPPRLKVMSLTDNTAWITALANDLDYREIFVEQLAHFASPGDVAIALSGSGDSANVIRAIQWAERRGLAAFGLTGFDGGRLKRIQQDGLHVPLEDMGMVESIHLAALHWTVDRLREQAGGAKAPGPRK